MKNPKKSETGRLFSRKSEEKPMAASAAQGGESPEIQTYHITNNTGAYLHCISATDYETYTDTWFGGESGKTGYLSGVVGDFWVFNFYKNYGDLENNTYYGTATFSVKSTVESGGWPYFAQETNTDSLCDRGETSSGEVKSEIYSFNWSNGNNFDPYTGANYKDNGILFSDLENVAPNLFAGTCGLIGLNADWTYFPTGSGQEFSLELPPDSSWGPASLYTYFLTENMTDEKKNFVWFPDQPARGNYTITTEYEQQVISQVAPYQNGNCWSRAYGALTQNSSTGEIDSAEEAAKLGMGATYGTWSIDFCAGDQEHLTCETFYLTERPYLSPESIVNYVDGQYGYLEVDGIETYWQNADNPQRDPSVDHNCLQGSAWCGDPNGQKQQTIPFPIDVGSDYVDVWVRSTIRVIPASDNADGIANIIYNYDVLNDDGSVNHAVTLPNGKEYWSLIDEDPDFCTGVLTPYLEKNPETKLYPYLSTWCDASVYVPEGYSVTTKYKNYAYSESWE